MTTTAVTHAPSTEPGHSIRGLVITSLLVVAAIAVLLVLVLGRALTSSPGSAGSGYGGDSSDCRPTTVAHYC